MIINVIIILNIKSTTQQLLSHLLWVDATSKDPLLLLLRQRGTICGFLRDLSSVASVTWLPWWHCHPSRYQHHRHRHKDLRRDWHHVPWLQILQLRIFSQILSTLSSWKRFRSRCGTMTGVFFFFFGNLSNNFEPLFHAGSPFSHYRCGRALRTQFGPGYR